MVELFATQHKALRFGEFVLVARDGLIDLPGLGPEGLRDTGGQHDPFATNNENVSRTDAAYR